MTTWILRRPEAEVRADVAAIDPGLPLAGRRLAVKDNIDVAGFPTTAALRGRTEAATVNAPVVDGLVAAGAVVSARPTSTSSPPAWSARAARSVRARARSPPAG